MDREMFLDPVARAYGCNRHLLYVTVRELFDRDDFTGLRILDVGAGRGLHACALAALGAHRVVAIEPEEHGSRAGVSIFFRQTMGRLGFDNIRLVPSTLQAFQSEGESFDRIMMFSSINHLDEDHVPALHRDPLSRRRYVELLKDVHGRLRPAGELVAHDVARSHLLAPLIRSGLLKRHPRLPTIEWDKHQDPEVWAGLMREAGFSLVTHHWAPFTRYDFIRRLVNRNSRLSWALHPCFVLRARR